ncbi:MAG: transposase [Beijerinckiaceae bacterium]
MAPRAKYSRGAFRYQRAATDRNWRVIELLLPKSKARGRPRGSAARVIVNTIVSVMRFSLLSIGSIAIGAVPLLYYRRRYRGRFYHDEFVR